MARRPQHNDLLAPEFLAALPANPVSCMPGNWRHGAVHALQVPTTQRWACRRSAGCRRRRRRRLLTSARPPPLSQVLTPSQLHILRQQIEALRRINVQLRALKYRARTGREDPGAAAGGRGGGSGRGRGRFLLALRWVLQAARNRWKRLRPRPLPAGPQVQALWLAGGGAGQGRGAAGAPLP